MTTVLLDKEEQLRSEDGSFVVAAQFKAEPDEVQPGRRLWYDKYMVIAFKEVDEDAPQES